MKKLDFKYVNENSYAIIGQKQELFELFLDLYYESIINKNFFHTGWNMAIGDEGWKYVKKGYPCDWRCSIAIRETGKNVEWNLLNANDTAGMLMSHAACTGGIKLEPVEKNNLIKSFNFSQDWFWTIPDDEVENPVWERDSIEEMRNAMMIAGVYTPADIEEICELERQYAEECLEIEEEIEKEGYPAHGATYDLRCIDARKFYDEQIALIDAKYDQEDKDDETEN